MKRTFIFSFILLNFSIKLFSQSNPDTLKPKIKIIKEILIGVVDENYEIEFERYKTDTTYLIRTDKRFFNRKGKLIEKQSSNHLLMTEQFHKYKLNKNGDWVNAEIFKSDGEINNMIYEYDSKNNLVSIKTYDNYKDLLKLQQSKFNNNGDVIEMKISEIKTNRTFRIVSFYDRRQLLERIIYKSDSSVYHRRNYKYDDEGKELEKIITNSDESITKIISEDDKLGNTVTENWFDEKGNKTKELTFKYEYDQNGNWIIKKRYSDGILKMIWERQIEYYE
ncbi:MULTISPECIES: hypothetical protein [Winogradskyella]|uniref:hypothetical protein n=1 Tax=Winogradskyella TaxID=286104 RepID=UPI0015CEB8CD|nr:MULTISPECIES: hypothetical protein [Winogradskyella]QXP80398.1 hypothetical protein H0I32_07175 [Winogradskyella sp. HaHa_3_26]